MSASESEADPQRTWLGAVWHEIWKSSIPVGLGVLAVVALTPWIQATLTEPSCDDPRDLRLVARSEMAAEATSENPFEQGAGYKPELAIDGDSSTSWVEGMPDTDPRKYGEGESLTITLDRARDVQLVCIINGYTKTKASYLHNARVRQLSVATERGVTDSVLPDKTLDFFAAYQVLNIAKGRTSTIAITIGTARAGQDSTQEADTAISEVEVWAQGE